MLVFVMINHLLIKMEKVENKHLRTNTQQTTNNLSNLEKIKALKKRADELSMEYHENIERLKFYDKDVEFMIRKMTGIDSKIEKLSIDYK
jgi:hypothetical protein